MKEVRIFHRKNLIAVETMIYKNSATSKIYRFKRDRGKYWKDHVERKEDNKLDKQANIQKPGY